MKDILVKRKRPKRDYERIIVVLGLTYPFTSYLFNKKSKVSIRRSARCFLLQCHVAIDDIQQFINTENLKSHAEFLTHFSSVSEIKSLFYYD